MEHEKFVDFMTDTSFPYISNKKVFTFIIYFIHCFRANSTEIRMFGALSHFNKLFSDLYFPDLENQKNVSILRGTGAYQNNIQRPNMF